MIALMTRLGGGIDDWQSIVAALDSAPVAVLVSDKLRRGMFVNKAFERLFGWTGREVVGGPIRIVPAGLEKEYEELSGRVREGGMIRDFETRRRARDGRLVSVRLSVSPFRFLENGRMEVGTIAVLAEKSDETRLEAELREKNVRLEAMIREHEALVAMLVHDLKSPLGAIKSNLGFVAQGESATAEDAEALSDTISLVDVMNRRVLDLLDVSRSEHAAMPLRRAPVSIAGLLTNTAAALQRRVLERGRILVLGEMPAGDVRVDADVFRRVLENLIENACKYGGKRVDVHAEIAGSRLVVRVEDDGPGVPAALRKRIFDRYARADSAYTNARGSHGLGLAFCRIACEAHGGSIRLEEGRGGACFVAEFDVAP